MWSEPISLFFFLPKLSFECFRGSLLTYFFLVAKRTDDALLVESRSEISPANALENHLDSFALLRNSDSENAADRLPVVRQDTALGKIPGLTFR
jgi:hypothetical protein